MPAVAAVAVVAAIAVVVAAKSPAVAVAVSVVAAVSVVVVVAVTCAPGLMVVAEGWEQVAFGPAAGHVLRSRELWLRLEEAKAL